MCHEMVEQLGTSKVEDKIRECEKDMKLLISQMKTSKNMKETARQIDSLLLTASTLRSELAHKEQSLLHLIMEQASSVDIDGEDTGLVEVCDNVPRIFYLYSQKCPDNVVQNLDRYGFGEFILEDGILSYRHASPAEI